MKRIARWVTGAVAAASIGFAAGNAQAYWIDFATSGIQGGIVQCETAGCTGTDIPINMGSWDNTNDGVIDGSIALGTPYPVLNFSTFSSANSIRISSGEATWLSGTFSAWNYDYGLSGQLIFSGIGPDTKSDFLLRELNIPLDTQWNFATFQLAASVTQCPQGAAGSSCYMVTSGDTLNTSVPAPASLALLGLGLAGLGVARRRRAA